MIVVAVVRAAGSRTLVRVVSITHRPPDKPDSAIELPLKVRQHLGMDDARAWAIVDELNEFAWPGFDLRPVSRNSDRTDFGFLPPRLFDTLISKLRVVWQIGAVKPSRSGLIVNLTPTA